MTRSKHFIFASFTSRAAAFVFAFGLLLVIPAEAATTSTLTFGLQAALNNILSFLQGPVMITVISIVMIASVAGIMIKSQRGESVSKLAIPLVAGLALLNVGSIMDALGLTATAVM
jgi:type IV secretory pathway VirB2 component (pilin)